MNLDFDAEPMFSTYVVLLLASGLILLLLSTSALGESTMWTRVLNALVGVGFLGYGFYLAFLFTGGTYLMVFKAFIVPVVLIVNWFRNRKARRAEPATQPTGVSSGHGV